MRPVHHATSFRPKWHETCNQSVIDFVYKPKGRPLALPLPSMFNRLKPYLLLSLLGLFGLTAKAQQGFVLNGNAIRQADSLFELTPDLGWRNGSIWNQRRIDLKENFRIYAQLNFGSNDGSGADGIAFVLQNKNKNAGSAGGGIGYEGISPSVTVEFDDFQNLPGDPAADHVAWTKNGNTSHGGSNDIVGPKTVANLENGQWHPVIFTWDANTQTFVCKLDGVQMFSKSYDLINFIFAGSQFTYFGFTASTGGLSNRQQVRIDSFFVSFENECSLVVNGAYKPWRQCWDDTSTLQVTFNAPTGTSTKIKWFNGDTTTLTKYKFDPSNRKAWVQISNKYGTCKDSGLVNIIRPVLDLPDIIDSSCVAQSYTIKVPGYSTYLWQDGSQNPTIIIDKEAKYSLKVTDGYGCKTQDSFTLTRKPNPVKLDSIWVLDASCFGYANGQARVVSTNKPWQKLNYYWSPSGAGTAQVTGLKAGSYKVRVSDQNFCVDSAIVVVSEPDRLQLQTTKITDVLCKSSPTGYAEIEATGGTPTYTFSWNPAQLGNSPTATNLYAGIYKAYAVDQNGCRDSINVLIQEPDTLLISVSGFRGDCAGDKKGFIECLTQGGTPAYSWTLTPPLSPVEKDPDGQHSAFRNLAAGSYLITATDANQCTDTAWQIVAAVPEIQLTIDTLVSIKTGSWTNLNANVNPPGDYRYDWTPIDSFRDQTNEISPRIRAFQRMLINLMVTDPNGCTQKASLALNTIDPLIEFWLPTAFTPDGNGRNDGYAPVGEFDRADFSIYNRWGQLLFVSSPSQPYWDGTYQGNLVPDGVYIVHADLHWTGVGQKRHGSASFTLLR